MNLQLKEIKTMTTIYNVKKYVCVMQFDLFVFICKSTHLKLKSGDAQRTATLGICGTKRIAQPT